MRSILLVLPFLAVAAPAAAEPVRDLSAVEKALRDPATADKLGRSLDGLTDALLSLKVGPIQAALEGREPTAAERNLTVGDIERRRNPQGEAELRAKIRDAGPAIAKGMNALASVLPVMTKTIQDIDRAVERAAANMPDPNYPKR